MDYREYFKKFEQDKEFIEAEQELKAIFDIADDVLRLRLEKGWSQTELAEHAETKQANISRLESGLSNPSVKFLQKVAKALDTSINIRFERIDVSAFDFSNQAVSQSQNAIPLPANWPRQNSVYTSYYGRSSSK
ncbi:MAG: XRE family transcriptional regulator [Anaerolineaceae bacterium]|nr:MAG: XRE family transcriptional regulator [Anaerolineaceae bacterium]